MLARNLAANAHAEKECQYDDNHHRRNTNGCAAGNSMTLPVP